MGNNRLDLAIPPPSVERHETKDAHAAAGRLALEIMHEIRNPLETLGYLSYLAFQEADDSDKVRAYMQLAEEQIRTVSLIASQTLSFAKVSQTATPIDLVKLAEAALRIHRSTIETKRIHLVRKVPSDLTAHVQGARILQVLSNLIANPLEAMPEAGQLTVRLTKRIAGIELLVCDNGCGIEAESMQRMFEPFFTTKGDGGNGLGLSLCKRIVEDHGGKITARSTARPGRSGSVFKVVLPY